MAPFVQILGISWLSITHGRPSWIRRMGQGSSNLTKLNQSGRGIMNAADFGLSDTVKLDHAFTFNIGEQWERPVRKISESLVKVGYHWAESFRIIAQGLCAYFVLAGLAKLVAATKSTDDYSRSKSRSSQHSSSRSKTGSTGSSTKATGSAVDEASTTTTSSPTTNTAHGSNSNENTQQDS